MKNLYFLLFSLLPINLFAQNWIPMADSLLGQSEGVFAISAPDTNVVWAISFDRNYTPGNAPPITYAPKVIRSIDGGMSWTVDTVFEVSGRFLMDIYALNKDTAFITSNAFGGTANPGQALYMTTDGGQIWNFVTNDYASGLLIRFFNEIDGIILRSNSMLKTNDGGNSWVPVSNPPNFEPGEVGFITNGTNSCAVYGNKIMFGSNLNKIWYSEDKGDTWNVSLDVVPSLSSSGIISSVAMKNENLMLALAQEVGGLSTIIRSSDGGLSWSIVADTLAVRELLNIPCTKSGFMALSKSTSPIGQKNAFYTLDSGTTWQTEISGEFGAGLFLSHEFGWLSSEELANDFDPAMYKYDGNIFDSDFDSTCLPTGLKTVSNLNKIVVFPNPVQDKMYIKNPENLKIQSIYVYDIHGKKIRTFGQIESASNELNISDIHNGLYIIEIILSDRIKVVRVYKD